MTSLPTIAANDIRRAVESAQQFGVSAVDFLYAVQQIWSDERRDQATRDDKTLTAAWEAARK